MPLEMNSIDRRRALRGLGLSLALPLLQRDVDASEKGDASSQRGPMRMVCVANPLGFVPENFFPVGTGKDYENSALLKPLDPFRNQTSVFKNLDHGVSGGHKAAHSFLSGIRATESANFDSRNVTVDQIAAESVGSATRFPSLVASVGANSGELECQTSWTRTGVNIPPITEAAKVFDALFVVGSAAERRAKRQAIAKHASVLDAVYLQAKSMKPSLGAADRRKLDEYLGSVRSVELRLQTSSGWIDRPKPQVDLDRPIAGQAFTKRLPLFYDLITLALQTDSTRVAALSIPGNLPVEDLGLAGNYHAFSHHGKSERLLKPLFEIELFQIKQFARFLKTLRSVEQPGGATLLDRTMVLCGSGMGNASSHSNKDLPVILAGGGLADGQCHVLPEESHRRIPLSNLFTTMLHQFGCHHVDRFNRATGTLPGLKVTEA